MKTHAIDERVRFAGLTNHNNSSMQTRAAEITGLAQEEPPALSFATAIRELPTAAESEVAWKVPRTVAKHLSDEALASFNATMEDEGITAYQAMRPGADEPAIFVETDRYQSFYCPELLRDWIRGNLTETVVKREDGQVQSIDGEATADAFVDEDVEILQQRKKDALWHVPSQDATVTNPVPIYGPLEEAIVEEELGDAMFGEIRRRKGGGEVHMDLLFDTFTIEFGADAEDDRRPSGGPIVLGIRTGYDFFGRRQLYAEGFAQDTSCINSIRAVTDRKTRRAIGSVEEDTREWWHEILQEMDLMTDQLTEMIEVANEITVDLMDMQFDEPFDYGPEVDNPETQAFYELAGFPAYLAKHAASHAMSRAADPFEPTMWDLHSGATYALSHAYTGSEDTSRSRELMGVANDMVMNPALTADRVEDSYEQAIAEDDSPGEQGTLEGETGRANVVRFAETLDQQREEFETRQERMREVLLPEVEDDDAEAEA